MYLFMSTVDSSLVHVVGDIFVLVDNVFGYVMCCREHRRFDNSTDISLKPAAGIKPATLKLADQFADKETSKLLGSV